MNLKARIKRLEDKAKNVDAMQTMQENAPCLLITCNGQPISDKMKSNEWSQWALDVMKKQSVIEQKKLENLKKG